MYISKGQDHVTHIGIPKHNYTNHLARLTCDKQDVDIDRGEPLARISHIIKSCREDLLELINSQGHEGCSIKHGD